MTTKTIDVLGLGFAAVDELFYVDAFPAVDTKTPIRRRERQCGGLAATALVAAARLGCRAAYAGILGDDEASRFVIERFHAEGVDTSHTLRRDGAGPVRATIIIDTALHTRTILYDMGGVVGVDSHWPPEEVVRRSGVLLVDYCGVEGMIRAARIARDAQIPIVADVESDEHAATAELLGLADHLILPGEFASRLTRQDDPAAAARALWTVDRRAVVVTCGASGSWYTSAADPVAVRHQPALAVEVVDTTGCGDVFHGAYAAALVHGRDVAGAVRFASAAAGLKAAAPGGQAGIPTRAAVEEQMKKED